MTGIDRVNINVSSFREEPEKARKIIGAANSVAPWYKCPKFDESSHREEGLPGSGVLGVEEPGIYDGILYWMCLDCGWRWHRWPEGHPIRQRAEDYVKNSKNDPVVAVNNTWKDPVESAQGQTLTPIFWGGPDGNVPDSRCCGVQIIMEPGKASTPHIHHEVQVQVTLNVGEPVCTLWGPRLENATWIDEGGTLVILPGTPHVALYPRGIAGELGVVEPSRTAVALEIRNHPDWRHDVVPMPELWPLAVEKATRLKIVDWIDWPDFVTNEQ